jgi:hypothetical protein
MTFTTRAGLTSCDTCHELVGQSWRDLAAHMDSHYMARLRAARQARIDAQINQEGRVS